MSPQFCTPSQIPGGHSTGKGAKPWRIFYLLLGVLLDCIAGVLCRAWTRQWGIAISRQKLFKANI